MSNIDSQTDYITPVQTCENQLMASHNVPLLSYDQRQAWIDAKIGRALWQQELTDCVKTTTPSYSPGVEPAPTTTEIPVITPSNDIKIGSYSIPLWLVVVAGGLGLALFLLFGKKLKF